MVHMDGMTVDEKTVSSVANFVLIYIVITTISTLLLALEGKDFTTTFSSVAACINNVGPGLGAVGPTLNYSCYTWFGKLVLSFAMLFGRLELYPMLALFIPSAWKKGSDGEHDALPPFFLRRRRRPVFPAMLLKKPG